VGEDEVAESGRSPLSFWETAFHRHGSEVLAYLARRLDRREDAEDLLQETFVRVIRARQGLRDAGKVRSYLFTTAHHLLINHLRRLRVALSEVETREMLRRTLAGAPDGERGVRARELRDRLAAVVESMTTPERRAFELGVLQRKPYDEIAAKLGWSRSQVKVNVYRARKRAMNGLRGLLDETPPGPGSD
jgi:RNA polymerase sigma factor (sigma-70 family)